MICTWNDMHVLDSGQRKEKGEMGDEWMKIASKREGKGSVRIHREKV